VIIVNAGSTGIETVLEVPVEVFTIKFGSVREY